MLVRFQVGTEVFLFYTASITDLKPTCIPLQWIPGAFYWV